MKKWIGIYILTVILAFLALSFGTSNEVCLNHPFIILQSNNSSFRCVSQSLNHTVETLKLNSLKTKWIEKINSMEWIFDELMINKSLTINIDKKNPDLDTMEIVLEMYYTVQKPIDHPKEQAKTIHSLNSIFNGQMAALNDKPEVTSVLLALNKKQSNIPLSEEFFRRQFLSLWKSFVSKRSKVDNFYHWNRNLTSILHWNPQWDVSVSSVEGVEKQIQTQFNKLGHLAGYSSQELLSHWELYIQGNPYLSNIAILVESVGLESFFIHEKPIFLLMDKKFWLAFPGGFILESNHSGPIPFLVSRTCDLKRSAWHKELFKKWIDFIDCSKMPSLNLDSMAEKTLRHLHIHKEFQYALFDGPALKMANEDLGWTSEEILNSLKNSISKPESPAILKGAVLKKENGIYRWYSPIPALQEFRWYDKTSG